MRRAYDIELKPEGESIIIHGEFYCVYCEHSNVFQHEFGFLQETFGHKCHYCEQWNELHLTLVIGVTKY